MKPIAIYVLSIILCMILITDVLTKNLKTKKKATKNTKATKAQKSKQLHLVKDHNGFKSSLNQVTRRSPTVTVSTKIGSEKLGAPPTILHMGNSNTSNGPNIGTFGPSAEIVGMKFIFFLIFFLILFFLIGPHMVMHSKGSFTTLSEEPAHIGWRNDKKVLTTLNRATGKMEQHQTTNRSPIYGTVQRVR